MKHQVAHGNRRGWRAQARCAVGVEPIEDLGAADLWDMAVGPVVQ